ncbi:MAG: hypothetical protein RIM96_08905 [Thalassobaculum sp.]|uniref:hypothetical protein n=1 Tax=Thalassobaculum sp. TaxID=2022740 RepID=UPI0032EC7516
MFAALGGLSLSVAADQLQEAIDLWVRASQPAGGCAGFICALVGFFSTAMGKLLAAVVLSLLFVLFAWGVVQRRDAFLRSRARIQRDRGVPSLPVVVTTLSPLRSGADGLPDRLAAAEAKLAALQAGDPGAAVPDDARQRLLAEICDPDAGNAFALWPWQQTLRMLAHHRSALSCVVVILSPEAEPLFERFKRLADGLMRPGCRIAAAGDPVALWDYNAVEDAVRRAIMQGIAAAGVPASKVCVDITGGTKVYSAAATVVTLNSPCAFGYVETHGSPEVGRVILYDAKIQG